MKADHGSRSNDSDRREVQRELAVLGAIVALSSSSCSGGTSMPDANLDANEAATSALIREVLAHEGEQLALASYRELARELAALEAATASLAADPSEANRAAAQDAFERVMDANERAELFQLGPAAPVGSTPEAAGLRDEYQPWPLVNACRIDMETVEGSYASDTLLAAEALNVRGLASLEYLLFTESAATVCSPTTSIVTDGSWAALGETEVWSRRAVYAHSAAVLARATVDDVVARWEGGFLERLRTAGAGSTTFPTAREGLNALSDALFYVYEPLLDLKIGRPAGLYTCVTTTCADDVESPWRDAAAPDGDVGGSLRALRVNLETFEDAYLGRVGGVDGRGLDDLVRWFGAEDLDRRMQEAIDVAQAALEAIEGPLRAAVVSRNEQVLAAVTAIDALTTMMTDELVPLLQLALPMRADGDND
jgi:predicted lipoprotein